MDLAPGRLSLQTKDPRELHRKTSEALQTATGWRRTREKVRRPTNQGRVEAKPTSPKMAATAEQNGTSTTEMQRPWIPRRETQTLHTVLRPGCPSQAALSPPTPSHSCLLGIPPRSPNGARQPRKV